MPQKITKAAKPPKKMKLVREAGKGERDSGRGLVPAASFGRYDEPYNSYLAELDPLANTDRSEALRRALAGSSDVRFVRFLQALYEPRFRTYALATIAKKCDISLPQFADFWQKAQSSRAIAKAQDALPDLVDDLKADARTKQIVCLRCDGFGVIYVDESFAELVATKQLGDRKVRPCPQCNGTGREDKIGDNDSRKMLLDMTGMSAKKGSGGASVHVNFSIPMESAVDKMRPITFGIDDDGDGDADVIDVEAESD